MDWSVLQSLYQQFLAAGYPPEQIPAAIQRLSQAQQQGQVGNLNIGTAEQDRADRLAEQARLAQEFRVQTGLGTAGLLQTDEQRKAAAEGDPFRFVEFLRGTSGLQNSANPVADLMSSGFSIKPQLPSDPRYNSLIDELASFGRPRQAAGGVKMMLKEPAVLMGAESHQPLATMAENGDEMMQMMGKGKVKVTPQKGVSKKLDPRRQDEIINSVMQMATGATIAPYPYAVKDPSGVTGPGFGGGGDAVPPTGSHRMPIMPRRTGPNIDLGGYALGPYGTGASRMQFPWNLNRMIRPWQRFATARVPGFADGGGWASEADRQRDIQRLASTPGAAESFAAYDRARASQGYGGRAPSVGSGGLQDPTFGSSVGTTAHPAGGAWYVTDQNGNITQIIANPNTSGSLDYMGNPVDPNQSYEIRHDASGVGRMYPVGPNDLNPQIAAYQSQQAALRFPNLANARTGGGRGNPLQWMNDTVISAGGRPGTLFPGDPGLAKGVPLFSYRSATPGGENARTLMGAGSYDTGPGPHNYAAAPYESGSPYTHAYTPAQEEYLRTHPNERYRPTGMAEGGEMDIPGNKWLNTPFGRFPGIGNPPATMPWNLWDKIGGNTIASDQARFHNSGSWQRNGNAATAPGTQTSGTVTPAQAAAMALGKGLANNPFAPSELVQALNAGQPANPAWLTQRLRNNIDPNLWQALLSVNQGFGYRPDAVLASAQRYDIPTFQTYYSPGA